jgi:hypothetical protein
LTTEKQIVPVLVGYECLRFWMEEDGVADGIAPEGDIKMLKQPNVERSIPGHFSRKAPDKDITIKVDRILNQDLETQT